MSILIKGMEMPTDGAERCIVIRGDGTIRTFTGAPIDYATAVPVPPHGRLKDADMLEKELQKAKGKYLVYKNDERAENVLLGIFIAEEAIRNAPTFLEAEDE